MTSGLDSRSRVLRAVSHREVDRVPCFFTAEDDVWARVMAHFGLRDRVEVIRHFGGDTIQVTCYRPTADLSGVETIDDLVRVPWPGVEAVDIDGYANRARAARKTGLAVLGGAWASIFTHARRSMGEEKYLMAMLDQPELIARIVANEAESYLAINEAIFSRCSDCLDVCYFGSDLGAQRSLFISRDLIRRFFVPHLRRLTQQAKSYGLKVMYHTCGAIAEIVPDLIECGIDALDPVQVSAAGMDPAALARRFKGQIAFHGGVSTQTLLPFATPDQVRDKVKRTIANLGPSGYVCGPDQSMMADIPIDNMTAMYEAARASG
jgi:uroporphyrinogen decarboxylase